VWESIQILLGLRVSESEKLRYSAYDIFDDGLSSRRPTQVATALAVLFHVILLLIYFPAMRDRVFIPTEQVLILKNLAPAGGDSAPRAAPPKIIRAAPKPQPILMPIPDPTPNDPEPIRKDELLEITPIVDEISAEFGIGDVNAPPGPPGLGGQGTGLTPGAGGGPGGDVYGYGTPGLSEPVLLVKTMPTYTDDAIKAKVQGVVLLQATIRTTGRVDSAVVLRGLGYGLEEKAIQEIVANWRFRPATLHGKPVNLQATIEVSFNLR
jgi:protein TonB